MRESYVTWDILKRLGCGFLVAFTVEVAGVRERLVLARELLEGLPLRLGNQERGTAAEQHEEGIDLQHVVHPRAIAGILSSAGLQGRDGALADDGANLATSRRDAMGGGPVSGWENFARDDKCRHLV